VTRTSIEWATDSWNPIAAYDIEDGRRGWFCVKVSPGCTNCYAEQWNRFRGNGHLYRVGNLEKVRFELAPTLTDPLHWRKPRRIFVNSMTDLFLEAHTDEMIEAVFTVMARAPRHEFLVLTKRPERMLNWFMRQSLVTTGEELFAAVGGRWPLPNVWLGVSAENQEQADLRIPLLLQAPAAIRFLSCEPLLGPIDLTRLRGPHNATWRDALGGRLHTGPAVLLDQGRIDWAIVGAESGARARPADLQWLRDLVSQCVANGVAPFVKQLGAVPMMHEADWRQQSEYGPVPLLSARNRDRVPAGYVPVKLFDRKGGNPAEWPEDLRVREFPKEAACPA
jgi:protein gp37